MKTALAALLLSLAVVLPVNAEEQKAEVKMYATSWCPYCAKARAYFARRGIAYVEVDIEKSREGRAEYDRLGARGIPVILVGQQRMNGFSEARLTQLLTDAGY
ncbi:MAG TPA: glutaredoxin family protein [Burkholderiales bacterium]|jgi:glutaredoxin|nr:glutaredoxin family protein [Burkholderiales bacterium]